MEKSLASSPIPMKLRDRCAKVFESLISEIEAIVKNPEASIPNRIAAFDKLGKFGLSGRNTVMISNWELLDIVVHIAWEVFDPPRERMHELVRQVRKELEARGGKLEEPDDCDDAEGSDG